MGYVLTHSAFTNHAVVVSAISRANREMVRRLVDVVCVLREIQIILGL